MQKTALNLTDGHEDGNPSNSGGLAKQNALRRLKNTVVNVDIGESNPNVIKFDFVSLENGSGRYLTKTYDMQTGLFDILTEYYNREFDFFISSKKVQSFLLALQKTENELYEKTTWTFREYCGIINSSALKSTATEKKFKDCLTQPMANGYGVCDEALHFRKAREGLLKEHNHMSDCMKTVKRLYRKYLSEISKRKFCCVCINSTEKIPTSFFMDPLIGMPLLIHHEQFGKKFIKNIVKPFIGSKLFSDAEIEEMSVDLWLVMPDAAIKDVLSICGKDGELTCKYESPNSFEDENQWTIGKFDSLKFTKSSFVAETETEAHETVIGY